MADQLFIADREVLDGAIDLLRDHGRDAATAAAARADLSRGRGNIRHFCRWRQIERLVTLLAEERVQGTLH